MPYIEISGYFAAFLMGLTLGTIGSGGSILTVPILVYLLGLSPILATGYSLLIVGSAAAFGAMRYFRQGLIDMKAALTFAIPSVIAVYLTRAYVMPALPDPLLETPFILSKGTAIMVCFAFLMVASALMMLRNCNTEKTHNHNTDHATGLIILEGAIVGLVTGILGAGGGFLIIPALVLMMGMDMKRAVGASLMVIALKSLIGFVGDIQSGIQFQLPLLFYVLIATFAGIFLATQISHHLNETKLQKFFAYFTLCIATIVLTKELL